MSSLLLKNGNPEEKKNKALDFCRKFLERNRYKKYVMGRNVYSENVISKLNIDGVIDDFTTEKLFQGCPILKTKDLSKNALVINAVGGKTLTASSALNKLDIQNLDYFSFRKYSGIDLPSVIFNKGFCKEFKKHEREYHWIYEKLEDDESKIIFKKLVSFRYDNDIEHLKGFESREKEQYFEELLKLNKANETYIDVGGYDGFNVKQFVDRCPDYQGIYVLEPDRDNYKVCCQNLKYFRDVSILNKGLSDEKAKLRFTQQGSGSAVSSSGEIVIEVDRLDDILDGSVKPTFIKMDIEGAEMAAIEGSKRIIFECHPRLAICVYHKPGDFWRLPEAILKIRSDYRIYLRHYTETIYETVMFFMPSS
ncbi:MAG: FkbM family methyltransferase [Candidatus Thiodiazotropha sp. (ex Myrtea sp. 'scaly one' KF741663)]|nr:FkbM family methyltransferase [Candidatus Thiodiazotropha sp. (ex Myrtea sp. 'scaly one' KF741663)]